MEKSVTPKPLDRSGAIPIFDVRHVPLAQLHDDPQVRDWVKRLASSFDEQPHLRAAMFSSSI